MKKLALIFFALFFSFCFWNAEAGEFQAQSITQQEANKQFNYEILVHLPYFKDQSAAADQLNLLIRKRMQQQVESFKKDAQDFSGSASLNSSSSLSVQYKVFMLPTKTAPIVSLQFVFDSYLAGTPHPSLTHEVLNYDLRQNKELSLEDLFRKDSNYMAAIQRYCQFQLQKKTSMSADEIMPLLNYAKWNIQSKGLLFVFDDFPHALGAQEVLVPYAQVKNYILTSSVLYMIQKNNPSSLH